MQKRSEGIVPLSCGIARSLYRHRQTADGRMHKVFANIAEGDGGYVLSFPSIMALDAAPVLSGAFGWQLGDAAGYGSLAFPGVPETAYPDYVGHGQWPLMTY